jgi:DNA-binding NarL/FixJ family response regulator
VTSCSSSQWLQSLQFVAPVLHGRARGPTNKEIASALGVAVSTLERHLVNLYTKIGARGSADAIAYAHRHGLAPLV